MPATSGLYRAYMLLQEQIPNTDPLFYLAVATLLPACFIFFLFNNFTISVQIKIKLRMK